VKILNNIKMKSILKQSSKSTTEKFKKVGFSNDTKDITIKTNTERFKPSRGARITKRIRRYLDNEQYDIITSHLENFSDSEIEDFFIKEGRMHFYSALFSYNSKRIEFLLKTIPINATKNIFRQRNNFLIGDFVDFLDYREKNGLLKPEMIIAAKEIFSLLLDYSYNYDNEILSMLEQSIYSDEVSEVVRKPFEDLRKNYYNAC
jgi:hypothetical protein